MATIDLGPRGHYADIADVSGARQYGLRRELFPAIRWGAVLAGVAVGISVQLVLSLLGVATGLSALDVNQSEGISPMASLAWATICMVASAFIGGYLAARLCGLKRKVDGLVHGAVAWAVTTLLFAMLATSVTGSMISGVFRTLAPMTQNSGSNVTYGGGESAVDALLRSQGGSGINAQTLQQLQSDIRSGQREDATRLLANSTGMDRARAAGVVDQALILSGAPERASASSRAAANRAIEGASATAWTVFAAVAISLALALLGGYLGTLGAHRNSWATSAVKVPDTNPPRP